MLELTDLPPTASLALSQTLKLLPRVSAVRTVGGVQTYPEGGYEGLFHRGSLASEWRGLRERAEYEAAIQQRTGTARLAAVAEGS